MPIDDGRAQRIEDQLTELTKAIQKLILIDERQIEQGRRLGTIEDRLGKLEKDQAVLTTKVGQYFWFVLGVGGTITTILAVSQAITPLLQHLMRP